MEEDPAFYTKFSVLIQNVIDAYRQKQISDLEYLKRITEAKRRSGKNYMMMETTLYTYQYFYVSEMIRNGRQKKKDTLLKIRRNPEKSFGIAIGTIFSIGSELLKNMHLGLTKFIL